MKTIHLFAIVTMLLTLPLWAETVIDRDKYADLLEDPDATRLLEIFLDPAVLHSPTHLTPEYKATLAWLHQQQGKAFPVLLEIFKREDGKTQYSVNTKAAILGYFETRTGDRSGILPEIRKQLPAWHQREDPGGNLAAFFNGCFRLLAEYGGEEDIALLESFADARSSRARSLAIEKALPKLKQRLEREKAQAQRRRPGRYPGDDAFASPAGENSSGSGAEAAADHELVSKWPWFVIGALLVGSLAAAWQWFRRRKLLTR